MDPDFLRNIFQGLSDKKIYKKYFLKDLRPQTFVFLKYFQRTFGHGFLKDPQSNECRFVLDYF